MRRRRVKSTDAPKKLEREGVRIAIQSLRRQGLRPEDVSSRREGYDLLLDGRRIEVKASTGKRAWMEVDIRKSCRFMVDTNTRKDIRRRGFPFDEIIEVTLMGKPNGPKIYNYPRSAMRRHGQFRAKTIWKVQVPQAERNEYLLGSTDHREGQGRLGKRPARAPRTTPAHGSSGSNFAPDE